jgi:citrate lyase subunit beta / citryl-CoA lyase
MFENMAAVVRLGLDGLMIPKADGAFEILRVAAELDRLEAATGMPVGLVSIVVVATETAAAMFNLGRYTPPHLRLVVLTLSLWLHCRRSG